MPVKITNVLRTLELEEKILNAGALVAMVGVFLPWMSGEWLGGEYEMHTGFGFFTSFLGLSVFLLLAALVSLTASPLFGGPVVVRKRHRDFVRLCLSMQAAILTIASLSVLTKTTFEFSRMEVRFGIYVTLIGCIITLIYSVLRYQEHRRAQAQEVFHHPENPETSERREGPSQVPPPPPPPPAPDAEDHRLFP